MDWRDRLDQNVVRQITISGMNQIWGPVLTSWRREDSQLTADCGTVKPLLGTGVGSGQESHSSGSITTVI